MNCLEWQIEILCWGNNFGNFEVLSWKLFIEHFVELDELFQKSGSHTPKPLVAAVWPLTQKLKTRKKYKLFVAATAPRSGFGVWYPDFWNQFFELYLEVLYTFFTIESN